MTDVSSPLASLVQLSLGQYLRRYHRHEIHIDAEIPEPTLISVKKILTTCFGGFGGFGGWLRWRSRVRRGGGRERQRTVAATCGFAQVDRLVSSVMSAWAAWPR